MRAFVSGLALIAGAAVTVAGHWVTGPLLCLLVVCLLLVR